MRYGAKKEEMLFFSSAKEQSGEKQCLRVAGFAFGWLEAEESFLSLNGRKRPFHWGVSAYLFSSTCREADDEHITHVPYRIINQQRMPSLLYQKYVLYICMFSPYVIGSLCNRGPYAT